MAGLNTLRTKGGLLLTIVIGGALLLFIISLAFEHGGMGNNDPQVAVINGEKITYTQYQDNYDATKSMLSLMNGQDYFSNEEQDAIHNVAWQQLLNRYALMPGFETLGVNLSEDERVELISGEYVSPVIRQAFTDPSTGQFDPENVVNYLNAAAADTQYGPAMQQRYEYLVTEARLQRLMEKYVGLVSKGIFVNDLEVDRGLIAANKTFSGRWVGKSYHEVPDSTIEVSNADIEKYYNENKRAFKQSPSRSISYVVFEVLPTEADRLAAAGEVERMAREFAAAEDPMIYAKSKSRETVDENYYSRSALTEEMAAIAFGDDRTAMLGPVLENDVYHLSRVADMKMIPDSIGISYIVLAQNAAKADSILTAAKNGADFAALATEFSEEPTTAQLGGEVGVLPYAAYPESLREALDGAAKGDIFKADLGQAVCIVRVDRKDAPVMKARIATITYPIVPSAATEKEVHSKASQFSVAAKGSLDKFNAAASENAVVPRVARIMSTEREIAGLADSREVVRWAFGADEGDVSDIFTVGGDYVVATLTENRDSEYATLGQVYNDIRLVVLNNKKHEYLASLVAGKSLEEAAAALGKEVGQFSNVRSSLLYVDGVGMAPRMVGAIAAAKEGQISAPVEDITGTYVFVVDKIDAEERQTADKERVRLEATAEGRVGQRLTMALYEESNIEDGRVKYF